MTRSATLIMAHDIGTTGNKATLFDAEGRLMASAFAGYATAVPRLNWAEQSPEDWWKAVCGTTRALLQQVHARAEQVAVITFSGQMMGCLPVDATGRPLRNAIIWSDQRSIEQARVIGERVGEERVYRIAGHPLSSTYSAAKIMWVREHEHDVFAAAHKFLLAKDYIVHRLTGAFATDPSDAAGTQLYDIELRRWSGEMLDAAELDTRRLPTVFLSTAVVGEVTKASAEEIGLAPGTPVVIGGGDGACAAVGAGAVREGTAYTYIGSSGWIGVPSARPIYDPKRRTFVEMHLVPDMYISQGTMQAAGGSYQWLRDTICQPELAQAQRIDGNVYALMDTLAGAAEPGAEGLLFLPYLLGERSPWWNPRARAAFVGLTARHRREEMARAVLEGVALNLNIILRAFTEQGASVSEIRIVGGGAQGAVWRQIMADIYGKPILKPRHLDMATSLGAALAGGIGVGLYSGFAEAERLTQAAEVIHPRPQYRARYDALFDLFQRSYLNLKAISEDLSSLP